MITLPHVDPLLIVNTMDEIIDVDSIVEGLESRNVEDSTTNGYMGKVRQMTAIMEHKLKHLDILEIVAGR